MTGGIPGTLRMNGEVITTNHGDEIIDLFHDGIAQANVLEVLDMTDDFPYTLVGIIGIDQDFLDGGFADSSCGIIDDSLQGFLIFMIDGKTVVGKQILYFLALIEGQSAEDTVGRSEERR